MPNDDRLIELVAEMLIELRKIDKRIENLEGQQARTNTLLHQHGRDLVKIVELLDDRVVHWGDNIHIEGEHGVTGGVTKQR